jgi:hypothetical protein
MCSAAWTFHDDGYEIVFNRDEQWTRVPSADPKLETQHPVPGLCARDPAGGGSWLFVNDAGITFALMNAYAHTVGNPFATTSRGRLPLLAGRVTQSSEIESIISQVEWTQHAPCYLLTWSPSGFTSHLWTGQDLQKLTPPQRDFMTTSSVRTESICRARVRRFDELIGHPLLEIMSDDYEAEPAAAIFLKRSDAGTVSQSQVQVTEAGISLAVQRSGEPKLQVSTPRRL